MIVNMIPQVFFGIQLHFNVNLTKGEGNMTGVGLYSIYKPTQLTLIN